MSENNDLKDNHRGSLGQMLRIYNVHGDLYKGKLLWISIALNLILQVYLIVWGGDPLPFIKTLSELYIDILPNLLGFNLGAYALLIGLSSTYLIDKMSQLGDDKFSSFQRASSVFGFCVLLEATALIVAFIVKLSIELQSTLENNIFHFSDVIFRNINYVIVFLLNLLGIYSIIILLSVIQSIFAVSQAAHFFSVVKGLQKPKNNVTDQSSSKTGD